MMLLFPSIFPFLVLFPSFLFPLENYLGDSLVTLVREYIKNNANKDPQEIVIDEFIGQSIPIYLFEISHGSERSSDEIIFFYIISFILQSVDWITNKFPIIRRQDGIGQFLPIIFGTVAIAGVGFALGMYTFYHKINKIFELGKLKVSLNFS